MTDTGRRATNVVLLVVLLPLIAFVLARLTGQESSRPVVVMQSTTPILLLPAYVVFAFAIALRLRVAATGAAVVIVCHLVWALPEISSARELPAAVAAQPSLKLYSHNVRYDNPTPTLLPGAIDRADADIVVLQEFSYTALEILRDSGVLSRYPYEFLHPFNAPQGLGVFSKLPLTDPTVLAMPGFPAIRAGVEFGATPFALYAVHAQSPVQGSVSFWRRDLQSLRDLLANEPGAVVAAGDFNATYGNREFREILDAGFTEGHMDVGRGLARTWPADIAPGRIVNGWLRLDHVVTSEHVRVTRIEEGPALGSDHRSIVATVTIVSGVGNAGQKTR